MAPDDGRKYVLRPGDDGTGTTLGSVPEGYYAPPTFEPGEPIMTLEEAVECVGCWLDDMVGVLPPRLLEALPLLLAAAKRPRVYALGEEERKVLTLLRVQNHAIAQNRREVGVATADSYQEIADACAAALSLEQPEEPFTVEELGIIHGWAGFKWNNPGPWSIAEDNLVAKLRAYIEKKEKEKE